MKITAVKGEDIYVQTRLPRSRYLS